MEQLKHLLQQVSEIVVAEKTLQEEKRKRGENFNVFDVLGLQTSEVRLHSALIAELLRPDGGHGLGDKFIKAFLEVLDKHYEEPFCFDSKSAKVEVEYPIGTISEDGETGGRIDLLIRDNSGQTLIIENKIYAGDQDRQLSRYNNYAKEGLHLSDDQVKLLYLSLYEGESPSKKSLGKGKFNYICISYSKDILSWLNNCIALSALFPLVRETISQYKNTIEILTNQDMETTNKEKLLELMTSNVDSVTALLNAQGDYKQYIYNTFVKTRFIEFCKQQNLIFNEANPLKETGERGFYFRKEEWNSAAIWIYSPGANDGYRLGVSNYRGGAMNVEKIQLDCLSEKPDNDWPYGWEYVHNFIYWDWNTYAEMLKGNFSKYVEEKVLKILSELEAKELAMP